jgi:hypothetical protein
VIKEELASGAVDFAGVFNLGMYQFTAYIFYLFVVFDGLFYVFDGVGWRNP